MFEGSPNIKPAFNNHANGINSLYFDGFKEDGLGAEVDLPTVLKK